MYNLRRVFAFWVAAALLFGLGTEAAAQTVTLPTTGVSHTRGGRGNLLNTQINYRDCADNDKIKFGLALTNRGSYTLEVWAGAGCNDPAIRQSSSQTQCYKLYSELPVNNQPAPEISVRDILYIRTTAFSGTTSTDGTGGADSTAGTGGTAAGTGGTGGDETTGGTGGSDAVAGGGTAGTAGTAGAGTAGSTSTGAPNYCTLTSNNSTATTITVFFMLIDPGDQSVKGTYAQWVPSYKLSAPAAPTGITAGIGESIIPLNFTAPDNSDMALQGYRMYCDPPPGRAAAEEAGVIPPEGSIGVCTPSAVLVAGKVPDEANFCGTAEKTATRGSATGLVNGVAYNVSIATTDTYFNVGVLSAPVCAIPQPVTGFFEAYRGAGGEGGGGFCSISRHREPIVLLTLLGLASCLVLRRRRAT